MKNKPAMFRSKAGEERGDRAVVGLSAQPPGGSDLNLAAGDQSVMTVVLAVAPTQLNLSICGDENPPLNKHLSAQSATPKVLLTALEKQRCCSWQGIRAVLCPTSTAALRAAISRLLLSQSATLLISGFDSERFVLYLRLVSLALANRIALILRGNRLLLTLHLRLSQVPSC